MLDHAAQATRATGEWVGIAEAAKHLGVSVGFLRKKVRQKEVPFCRAGTKVLRFRLSDLDGWMKANGYGGEINYRKM